MPTNIGRVVLGFVGQREGEVKRSVRRLITRNSEMNATVWGGEGAMLSLEGRETRDVLPENEGVDALRPLQCAQGLEIA